MKAKLQPEQADALRVSVFIAKTTRRITQQQVADGFDIHLWTLRRYYLPEARELDRLLSKKQTHLRLLNSRMRKVSPGTLSKDGDERKCPDCGIILEYAPQHNCMLVRNTHHEYGNSH